MFYFKEDEKLVTIFNDDKSFTMYRDNPDWENLCKWLNRIV
jgi:hypothetical protein